MIWGHAICIGRHAGVARRHASCGTARLRMLVFWRIDGGLAGFDAIAISRFWCIETGLVDR